ncbi:MerR family transcriptional regulator [Streptomyces armeniacus]|uniref:MerR family transcriptional regulator n=1 Tax=Streptomyces armeniacus TaxID=83291 RepID=A0A345XT39_9ACTN|nr:MerR family transcriptional regulator [Streptomyces armeniacus]AXK34805.1 MerR family transcriptional regulator [Streptomyces armeniacus]
MPAAEYRIEDLAHRSGATVRTIRAYQDRGLLPKPERRGRANVYDDTHLARLRQIAGLLDRGYTLASIKELLEAWDAGRGLGGVLGLVTEVDGPWSDEESSRLTRAELNELFGGEYDDDAVAEAVSLGVLVPVPDSGGEFVVPSPQELAVAAELHKAGVPLSAISAHLRELRGRVEHIATRFLDFTNEHVFVRYLGHTPSSTEVSEAADLVRRLRPLAQQAVDAELARAMQLVATRSLRDHLRSATAPPTAAPAPAPGTGTGTGTGTGSGAAAGCGWAPEPGPGAVAEEIRAPGTAPAAESAIAAGGGAAEEAVLLPAATVESVRALVGAEHTAAFVAAAAEREVAARTMDRLTDAGGRDGGGRKDTSGV